MATITEDYVSFETAKLLKEKGFKGDRSNFYERGRLIDFRNYWWRITPKERYEAIEAPTLQMACKWLREKYNIVISVNPQKDKYSFTPWQLRDSEWVFTKALLPIYDKHEEACNAAIRYCLENLI